jgi:hypothetical protein
VQPGVAKAYTALLTYAVAERHSLDAVTDDPVAHRAFGDASFRRIQTSLAGHFGMPDPLGGTPLDARELRSYYLDLAIRTVVSRRTSMKFPSSAHASFVGTTTRS